MTVTKSSATFFLQRISKFKAVAPNSFNKISTLHHSFHSVSPPRRKTCKISQIYSLQVHSALMALRSLDNTLPLTPERPKKTIKVSNSIAKPNPKPKLPADSNVNNENVAPLDPVVPAVDSVDYVSSEDLKPLSDPDVKLQGLIEGLESKDWLKVCDSLNDVRRMALFHSTLLLPILDKVVLVLVKSIKNPRSALCKTSIMAASDLFKSYNDKLLESTTSDAVDHMILQLLLKASQDKKFVCEEAERALKTMVEFIAPIPLLHKLKAYVSHANMRVRAKAAVSISHSVSKMDVGEMREYGVVLLIQMAAELMKDRLPEAREAARSMVLVIYKAVMEEGSEEEEEKWQNFCQVNLSAIDALAMVKLIASSQ